MYRNTQGILQCIDEDTSTLNAPLEVCHMNVYLTTVTSVECKRLHAKIAYHGCTLPYLPLVVCLTYYCLSKTGHEWSDSPPPSSQARIQGCCQGSPPA